MRELPENIDADVVIEISKLLDEHPYMVPVPVHKFAELVRQGQDRSTRSDHEELVIEMATTRQLAMVFDLPNHENVVPLPVRR